MPPITNQQGSAQQQPNSSSSAPQKSPGAGLSASVGAVQEVFTSPTIEQFQRWLETEAHTAHQQFSLGYGHETLQQEVDCSLNAIKRIVKLRAGMELLLDFKAQA